MFEITEAWKSAFPDVHADVLVIQYVPIPASHADEVILTFTHPWIIEKSYPGRLNQPL